MQNYHTNAASRAQLSYGKVGREGGGGLTVRSVIKVWWLCTRIILSGLKPVNVMCVCGQYSGDDNTKQGVFLSYNVILSRSLYTVFRFNPWRRWPTSINAHGVYTQENVFGNVIPAYVNFSPVSGKSIPHRQNLLFNPAMQSVQWRTRRSHFECANSIVSHYFLGHRPAEARPGSHRPRWYPLP